MTRGCRFLVEIECTAGLPSGDQLHRELCKGIQAILGSFRIEQARQAIESRQQRLTVIDPVESNIVGQFQAANGALELVVLEFGLIGILHDAEGRMRHSRRLAGLLATDGRRVSQYLWAVCRCRSLALGLPVTQRLHDLLV
jgi:hypothetical protein